MKNNPRTIQSQRSPNAFALHGWAAFMPEVQEAAHYLECLPKTERMMAFYELSFEGPAMEAILEHLDGLK